MVLNVYVPTHTSSLNISVLLWAVQFHKWQTVFTYKAQHKHFRLAQYMQLHLVTSFTLKHSSRFTHLTMQPNRIPVIVGMPLMFEKCCRQHLAHPLYVRRLCLKYKESLI